MTMAIHTDMAVAFDVEKIPPAIVAASALDAQIEREFLAITGAETTAT